MKEKPIAETGLDHWFFQAAGIISELGRNLPYAFQLRYRLVGFLVILYSLLIGFSLGYGIGSIITSVGGLLAFVVVVVSAIVYFGLSQYFSVSDMNRVLSPNKKYFSTSIIFFSPMILFTFVATSPLTIKIFDRSIIEKYTLLLEKTTIEENRKESEQWVAVAKSQLYTLLDLLERIWILREKYDMSGDFTAVLAKSKGEIRDLIERQNTLSYSQFGLMEKLKNLTDYYENEFRLLIEHLENIEHESKNLKNEEIQYSYIKSVDRVYTIVPKIENNLLTISNLRAKIIEKISSESIENGKKLSIFEYFEFSIQVILDSETNLFIFLIMQFSCGGFIFFILRLRFFNTSRYDKLLTQYFARYDEQKPQDKTVLKDPELKDQLALVNERLKQDPRNLEILKEKASLLRKLNYESEYYETMRKIDRLMDQRDFTENAGKSWRIRRLACRDIHFYGTFDWQLNPHINILLGKNGYGKSHLLSMFCTLLQRSKENVHDYIHDDSRSTAEISLGVGYDDQERNIKISRIGFEEDAGIVPVLAISELRFIDKSRNTFGPDDMTDVLKTEEGALRFLKKRNMGGLFQNFLLGLCITYSERKTLELPIIKLYQKIFTHLTGGEFAIDAIKRIDDTHYAFTVFTDGNSRALPLQQSSQGTLSIMGIFSLIFKYLTLLYPDVPETEICKKSGIVIIDELDAHIHPSWQKRIVSLLRDTFPSIQFILAMHSPLAAAGCKEGEVTVLRRREKDGFRLEQSENHFVGATTSELYQQLFEVDERDDTFLRYAAMYPLKGKIEKEIKELECQQQMDEKELDRYDQLIQAIESAEAEIAENNGKRKSQARKRLDAIIQDTPSHLEQLNRNRRELEKLLQSKKLPFNKQQRLNKLYEDRYYIKIYENIVRRTANRDK